MSAFLGPIHYWLYNKIQLQEELIREIVSFGEESSWKVFSDKKLAEETVNKELRPLNELIDVMNIHGWLQERIQDVESRYALLVTHILKEDEKHLPALEEVAYNFGKEHALDASSDASDAYRKMDDSLLNGMPCDRVNVLTEQDPERTSWVQEEDIHAPFWIEAGGDPGVYYRLRKKIKGCSALQRFIFKQTTVDVTAFSSKDRFPKKGFPKPDETEAERN